MAEKLQLHHPWLVAVWPGMGHVALNAGVYLLAKLSMSVVAEMEVNDLFDVEADLCLAEKGPGGARLTVTDAQVEWIEKEIDRLNADLEPLRSFIRPGGSPAAAYLHLARTVCRRAERMMVELNDQPGEAVGTPALKYVNRLSDFLFVAGRYANDKGARDVLWAPGQNR